MRRSGVRVPSQAPAHRPAGHRRPVLTRDEIDQLEGAAATDRDQLMIPVLADTGPVGRGAVRAAAGGCVAPPHGSASPRRGQGWEAPARSAEPRCPPPGGVLLAAAGGRTGHDLFRAAPRDPSGEFRPLTRNGVLQMVKGTRRLGPAPQTDLPAPPTTQIRHRGSAAGDGSGAVGRHPRPQRHADDRAVVQPSQSRRLVRLGGEDARRRWSRREVGVPALAGSRQNRFRMIRFIRSI